MIELAPVIVDNEPSIMVYAIRGISNNPNKKGFNPLKLDTKSKVSVKLNFDDIVKILQVTKNKKDEVTFMRTPNEKIINVKSIDHEHIVIGVNKVAVRIEKTVLQQWLLFMLDAMKYKIEINRISRRNTDVGSTYAEKIIPPSQRTSNAVYIDDEDIIEEEE